MRICVMLVAALSLLLGLVLCAPAPLSAQGATPAAETATPIAAPETPVSREVEPNNRFSQANPIAPTGTVAGTIDPIRDHDWYQLSIDTPGRLRVLITAVPADMNYAFQVWTADKEVSAGWQSASQPGTDTDVNVDLPDAGTYFLELAQSNDNAASAQPYQLQTTFTAAIDDFVGNNSFLDAAPLIPGTPQQACIFPRGEHDWYKLSVDTPGELHVVVTPVITYMNYALQAWNANKDVIQGWQGAPQDGTDTDVIVDVPKAGNYYLELAQSNDNAASVQSYQLKTTFTPTADVFGANNSFADAAPLAPDSPQLAYIFPRGEHDWFTFQSPGRAQARVLISRVPADLTPAFQVWTANKDVLLGWQTTSAPGMDADVTFDLPKAGTFYLELAQNNDSGRSTQPYTLQVTVTPAVDGAEYNDRFTRARTIGIGGETIGAIVPRGYHGWYRVDVSSPGTLSLSFARNPANLAMAAQVWNRDKDVVCGWQNASAAGADARFTCPINEAGTYYVETADSGDAHSSPDGYHLTVDFSQP